MPRPTMCRKVSYIPTNREFKPSTNDSGEVNTLKIEEVEALRLNDIEKLNQSECAAKMNVSRQTFQNIIDSARTKVARAIVNGTRIKISGGNFNYTEYDMKCHKCRHHFIAINQDERCPKCESNEITITDQKIVSRKDCKKRCCKRG